MRIRECFSERSLEKKFAFLCLFLLLTPIFSGCSTLNVANKKIDAANHEADRDLSDAVNRPAEEKTVRYHKTPWLFSSSDVVRLRDVRKKTRIEKVLPGFLLEKATWTDSRPVSIYDIAKWVTTTTGVPVEIHTPRLFASSMTGASSATSGAGAMGPSGAPLPPGGMGQPGALAGVAGNPMLAQQKWNRKLQMHWVDKPLSQFLDMVASGMGLFWDWDGHSIAFYRSATKTYRIVAPPVSSQVSDTISDVGSTGIMGLEQSMQGGGMGMMGGGMGMMGGTGATGGTGTTGSIPSAVAGGGIGATGGAGGMGAMGMMGGGQNTGMPGQSVSVTSNSTVWTELNQALQGIVGGNGSFTIMPSSGLVAVTTNPSVMRQVDDFVHHVNSTFGHQIWVEVRVIEVKLDRQDQQDINWQAVVHGAFGAGSGGAFTGSSLAQIFSGGTTSPIASTSFTLPGSNTNAIVKSLSTRYHTSEVTTVTVRTLNDQSAPIQDVTSQSYLAEILAGVAGIGQSTFSESIPSQVTTGFTANILPHLLDDGDHMILELSADLSALLSITTSPGTGGGSTIQLPNVSSRSFLQRIRIKSGQTAIISGYESVNAVAQQNGSLGNPGDFMFGGGVNAENSRTKIVILVTPIVEREAA